VCDAMNKFEVRNKACSLTHNLLDIIQYGSVSTIQSLEIPLNPP
jgi:hypothetical protein